MKSYMYCDQQNRREFFTESVEPSDTDIGHTGSFVGLAADTDYTILENEHNPRKIRQSNPL